jgi:thiol-disulfide isomerase/thioredoxin
MCYTYFNKQTLHFWKLFSVYIVVIVFLKLRQMFNPLKIGSHATPLDETIKYVQETKQIATPGMLGKVVIIEKWATWCPPCVQTIPHLNDIYMKYCDREDFQLVAITCESDVRMVRSFMIKYDMKYPVALDTVGLVSASYPSLGIPNATIVGKDGLVFWNGHPSMMDDYLEQALKMPSPSPASDFGVSSLGGHV